MRPPLVLALLAVAATRGRAVPGGLRLGHHRLELLIGRLAVQHLLVVTVQQRTLDGAIALGCIHRPKT